MGPSHVQLDPRRQVRIVVIDRDVLKSYNEYIEFKIKLAFIDGLMQSKVICDILVKNLPANSRDVRDRI